MIQTITQTTRVIARRCARPRVPLGPPGDAAALRARADGAPPRLAGDRAARDRRAGRARASSSRGPGRGTFVAARAGARRRRARPRLAGGRARRRARRRRRAGTSCSRPPPRGRARALVRLPRPDLQPIAALPRRWPAPRGARARGSAVPRRGASRRCGRGSRARSAGACARTTSSSAPAARPALATAFRALARAGRRRSLVESPTYLGAIAAARAAGLRPCPSRADADGVRPELLADALRAHRRARRLLPAAVRQPARRHAGPRAARGRARGRRATPARSWSRTTGRATSRSTDRRRRRWPPTTADGHVVYLRSLTKSAAPGAAGRRGGGARAGRRAAARGAPRRRPLRLRRRCRRRRSSSSARRPGAATCAALRAALRERRDALAAASPSSSCPTLRVAGRPGRRAAPLGGAARRHRRRRGGRRGAARGVVVYPGRPWFPADPPGPFLRLTFAGRAAGDARRGRAAPRARAQTMIATAPPSTDQAAPVTLLARSRAEEHDHGGDLASARRSGRAGSWTPAPASASSREMPRAAPAGRRARPSPIQSGEPTGAGRDGVDEHAVVRAGVGEHARERQLRRLRHRVGGVRQRRPLARATSRR